MKRVLIVGGGIAGITSAILLEEAGFEIDLVEIAKEWGPVGAGIVLWPNALKILERVGVRDEIESHGNVIEEMIVTDEGGKKISSLKFARLFEKGLFAIAAARAELHYALVSKLKNTKVILNDTVESINDTGDEVTVKLRSGTQKEYDLVIGADGINSKIRKILFPDASVRYSGNTNWRFMVSGDFDFNRTRAYEMWGRGKRFGMVPIGRGNTYYCFAVLNSPPGLNENRHITKEKFVNMLSEFGWKAKEFIRKIEDSTVLIHNDLEDIRLKEWYKGNVILIGDAAHGITPNLGAGAAMAMEDSILLVSSLVKFKDNKEAFRSSFDARYKRVNRILNDSYRVGKMGTINNGALRAARNFVSRIMPEWFYLNILKTVIGVK